MTNGTREPAMTFVDVRLSRGTWALGPLSATFSPATVTAVLGPSGSGKSTLLRLAVDLLQPSGGTISRPRADTRPQRPQFSMVFQDYMLYPHLSIRENVVLAFQHGRDLASKRAARIDASARDLGIAHLLDRAPDEVSGGERQRAALLKTMLSYADIWALDEPLSNLDAPVRARLRGEILAARAVSDATILWVTHDVTEALSVADQLIVLSEGTLLQAGRTADVLQEPAHILVARILFGASLVELRATLERDGVLVFEDGTRVPLPRSATPMLDAPTSVIAAVDASGIHTTGAATGGMRLTAPPVLVERTPREAVYAAPTSAGHVRFAALSTTEPPSALTCVTISPEAIRLFDSASGNAVRR